MADATWEPESHLAHAPAKVAEYWGSLGLCTAGWLSAPEDASDLTSTSDSSVAEVAPRWRRTLPPCQDD